MKKPDVEPRKTTKNEQIDPEELDLSLYDESNKGSGSMLPMRVQVYEQVSAWIRTRQLAPSAQLPTESVLCDMFGVSRTVIREALILLEEDAIVIRRRGIGRFVASQPPELGLEQLRPMERLLPTESVTRLETSIENPTSLVEQNLGVSAESEVLRWESLLITAEGPACLSEEWTPWPTPLSGATGRMLVRAIESGSDPEMSMSAVIWDCCGSAIGPSVSRITVTTAEERRAELLGTAVGAPLLAIVQVVHHLGQPLLCLKHLLRTDRGPLVVQQRRSGGPNT